LALVLSSVDRSATKTRPYMICGGRTTVVQYYALRASGSDPVGGVLANSPAPPGRKLSALRRPTAPPGWGGIVQRPVR